LTRRVPHPAAAGLGIVIAAAGMPAAAAPAQPAASDYEAAIARLEQPDPQAPEALNARLQYADFLADATTDANRGDCHARLDAAQAQLDTVAARPAIGVLLPLGPAKLASTAYKIHAARADCVTIQRTDELNKALDAARDAARLYRDGLDYQSAAIMQFNVAATLNALGDNQAAITALQTVIAMDREFGFQDDAQDNIRLLQHWQGDDESDAKIAELMKDFPAARVAEFKFAWAQGDTRMDIAATETNLTGGQLVQSTGKIALPRHVRQEPLDWIVSYDATDKASLDLGHWPANPDIYLKRFTAYMLTIALLDTPNYKVTSTGDFDDVTNPDNFSKALSAEVSAALGAAMPDQGDDNTGTSKALAQNLKTVMQPGYLEADTAQTYSLETATWAGAKLQQGTWYQMTAPLLLPGMGMGQYFLVTHNIAFSYARPVPCTAQDTAKSCAEIVIHATLVPADMAKAHVEMSSALHMPDFEALHYWSSINMRLVVRPGTLEPVLSDMRKSWYVAVDGALKRDPVISSERVVTSYH
jgi:tetratricopeptide (TPR) repeat protein